MKPFSIGGSQIAPGERKFIELDVASLYDHTKLHIPVEVIRGNQDGPTLFISAAIHGDELNGTEVIRRISQRVKQKGLRGTLILVPIVNVYGYNTQSRYLPDRRDLNRCFPGSKNGSLAARVASIFMKEIVRKSQYGIDLHTGAIHRSNLPQIRGCLDHEETKECSRAFGVPVILDSTLRDGSLREAARKRNLTMLLFEGGEALRLNEDVIKVATKGCFRVMRHIGMLGPAKSNLSQRKKQTYVARDSYWVRAVASGTVILKKQLGDEVSEGELLGIISDPLGKKALDLFCEEGGIVIGLSFLPLVSQGDAVVHIATFRDTKKVKNALSSLDDQVAGGQERA